MSNDFFNFTSALVRKTRARAEALNAIFTLIQTGFGYLPSKARIYESRIVYCGDATGPANAYVVTPPYAVTLTDGAHVRFRVPATNTGASTVNVYGLGVLALVNYAGAALAAGAAATDTIVDAVYNLASNHWRVINPLTTISSVSVNNLLKTSAADTTPDYAYSKIIVGGLLTKAIGSPAGNETINLSTTVYTATGTDTYVIVAAPVPTTLASIAFLVIFTNGNTGAATLNVGFGGAKAITKNGGTALVAGDIPALSLKLCVYDGTQFQINPTFVADEGLTALLADFFS